MKEIITAITAIIAIIIILNVGSQILKSSSESFDCSTVIGYNPIVPEKSTGWAHICLDIQEQHRNAGAVAIAVPAFMLFVLLAGTFKYYLQ